MKIVEFIIKYIVVFAETLLMLIAILITPVFLLLCDDRKQTMRDLIDTLRTLFGYCKEIVAL